MLGRTNANACKSSRCCGKHGLWSLKGIIEGEKGELSLAWGGIVGVGGVSGFEGLKEFYSAEMGREGYRCYRVKVNCID